MSKFLLVFLGHTNKTRSRYVDHYQNLSLGYNIGTHLKFFEIYEIGSINRFTNKIVEISPGRI